MEEYDVTHKHWIWKINDWISVSPVSEFIVVVKLIVPEPGFKKTLLKLTTCELPLVTLLPSGIDWAVILTPGLLLEIVKVPITSPVDAIDWIITWLAETIEFTIKTVLNEALPRVILAVPIVSPIDIVLIVKDPLSEAKSDVDISGSFGSWLTVIVKSVKLSQSVFEIETVTVGVKGIHGKSPVFPPTQLPQLSMYAEPPKSPLQSTQWIDWVAVCISTSPNSELIVDVKTIVPGVGFKNKLSRKISLLFPLVTLLLSGNDAAITITPGLVFSKVKDPYIVPVILSTALTEILLEFITKSTSKKVLTLINPPPAIMLLDPIVSLVFNPLKSKLPESDVKTVDEISGSFGSWLVKNTISE